MRWRQVEFDNCLIIKIGAVTNSSPLGHVNKLTEKQVGSVKWPILSVHNIWANSTYTYLSELMITLAEKQDYIRIETEKI